MQPRARRDALLVRTVGEQTVVFDQRRGRLHVLNRAAAVVWRHCDGQRPVGELAELVGRELGETVDERVVWLALARLRRAGLLEERVARPREGAGRSRRELLLGAARLAAGAVALPSVLTLAPQAAGSAAAKGPHKVLICHNGKTIEVDEHAVAAHLAHGDTLGPCPLPTTAGPTSTTRAPTTTTAAPTTTTTPAPTSTTGAPTTVAPTTSTTASPTTTAPTTTAPTTGTTGTTGAPTTTKAPTTILPAPEI